MNSKFFEEIGGEVRPSLQTIIGLSDLLLDMNVSAEQRSYIEVIQRSGQDVMQLLSSVVDLARMEAGSFRTVEAPFNIRMAIEEALDRFATEARERRTELTYYLADNGIDVFKADGYQISHILTYLLRDAVNRTIGGEIFLEGHRYIEADRCLIYLNLRDTGMALPDSLLRELNLQASKSANLEAVLRHPGHFDLFMSRALVRQLDGDIWFENNLEGGACITLTFNVAVEHQALKARTSRQSELFEDKRVLVVDDSATGREVLKRQLTGWEMRPVLAESASVALHLLQPGAEFDLVLIDEKLEDMSGVTLAAAIRHRDELSDTPLVLLGSNKEVDPRYWRLFAASIEKPLKSYQLFERVRSILQGSSADLQT